MTIEIRQLIIRATVSNENSGKEKARQSSNAQTGTNTAKQKNEIVRECVEQVMQILREERER